jgi:hypothetical protein
MGRSGSLSRLLARGGGPRPRSNGAGTGPLRKVVSVEYKAGVPFETYECGHVEIAKQDLMGYTNASRRRCRKCKGPQP